MSPTSELLILLLLIFGNALFVMSEMAIISSRKVRLQQLANHGSIKARAALELANAPNQFLPTVQIGITLMAIISGAFGENVLARQIEPIVSLIPGLEKYISMSTVSSGIAIVIITYLTLIIGELVPKRLALNNPEPIAMNVAIPLGMLAKITAPIVKLLSTSTEISLRILGIRPSNEPQVTEEEIKVLIEQGTEEGTFEEAEQDMVERVFRLGDRRVGALMTPRPDIVWLDLEDPWETNKQKMIDSGYSRFPVCQGGLDTVLGVITVTDLLSSCLNNQPIDMTVSLRRPLFVPESTRGFKVLESFKQSSTHLSLVVDEYGIIQGLVTLNDIFVEIVGDLPMIDEDDEPQAVQREDGSWLLDGMLPVEEFFELFNLEELPKEQRGNYHTMGGFIITHLGRIPAPTDHFDWESWRFEVISMDGNRVDQVLVISIPLDSSDSTSAD